MDRIYVTAPSDDPYEGPQRAGYFDQDVATYWHGDTYWDGNNRADKNTGDSRWGQGLYRTAQGRWVLHTWSRWQGEQPTYTYTADTAAHDWLLFNNYDKDAEKHFGEAEQERGPDLGGRPEIGGPVLLRLGDVLPLLDAYAKSNGFTRAYAARQLLYQALNEVS